MQNVSNKNLTTLSHLYKNPVPHRRDFVRENKQSIRDKSKQQTAKEKPQIDGYQPFSSSADQISSRSSGFTEAMKEHASKVAPSTPSKTKRSPTKKRMGQETKKQPWTYGREAADRKNEQKTQVITIDASLPPRRPFSSTKVKVVSLNKTKANTSSKAVQTDEINDEIYLYNALKKCASPAFKNSLKAKYLQKEKDSHSKQLANASQDIRLPLDDSHDLREHFEDVNREHVRQKAGDDKTQQRAESAQTVLSHDSQRSTVDYQTARDLYDYRSQHNELYSNLNVVTLPTDGVNKCSTSKCTNCPVGYHLLSETERETIRAKLLEHEALLIKQLNSFPLAIETLRVRQSKTRIEKELDILEQNLRKLTKRKVYAKIHE